MPKPLPKKAALATDALPSGFLKPAGKREGLALKALDEDRLADAAKHIAALPQSPPESGAWKLYLYASLKLKSHDLPGAEAAFLQAASLAFIWAFSEQPVNIAIPYRLIAMALESAGAVQRRGERATEAIAAHSAAYRLRIEHGSVDEQWQSALSLGISHSLAKEHKTAMQWLCRTLDFASRAVDAREQKLAWTYAQMATSSSELGGSDEAILAARKSLDHWRRHDISDAQVAEAEYRLGELLAALGEKKTVEEPHSAAAHLHEAIQCMRSAGLSLEAFGPAHQRTARICRDRLDFAEKLAASLASD